MHVEAKKEPKGSSDIHPIGVVLAIAFVIGVLALASWGLQQLGLTTWLAWATGILGLTFLCLAASFISESYSKPKGESESKAEQLPNSFDRSWSESFWWLFFSALFVWFGIGAGVEAVARGVTPWLAILVGVASSLLALVAIVCLFREGRTSLAYLPVFLLRQFLVIDLLAARRAAGRRGRVHRQASLLLWTDVESSIEPDVVETVERVFEEFPALTGLPINREPRLSLFCFEADAAFRKYCRPFARHEIPIAGYYMGGLRRKHILINHEMSMLIPMTLREIVAHEVMHFLLRAHLGKRLPMWLEEGLTTTMQRRFDNGAIAPGTRQRRLLAWKRRGDLLDASALGAASMAEFNDLSDLAIDKLVRFIQVYDLGAILVEYLADRQTGALRDFLCGIRKASSWQEWFHSCFGESFGEVFHLAMAWATVDSVSDHVKPAAWICEAIKEQLLPSLRDKTAPLPIRLQAISSLSRTGYVEWADDLIAVLEEDDPVLREYAQLGLDYLSGATGCASPAEWRAWLVEIKER